jgi:hypothetical protein
MRHCVGPEVVELPPPGASAARKIAMLERLGEGATMAVTELLVTDSTAPVSRVNCTNALLTMGVPTGVPLACANAALPVMATIKLVNAVSHSALSHSQRTAPRILFPWRIDAAKAGRLFTVRPASSVRVSCDTLRMAILVTTLRSKIAAQLQERACEVE